jgi:hypothetical protein
LPDVSHQGDLECSSEVVIEIGAPTSSAKRTAQQAETHSRDPEIALLEQIRERERNGLDRDKEALRLKEDSLGLAQAREVRLFKKYEIHEKNERLEEAIF